MINLFFQTPILSARVKDLLPIVLDYQDFTSEKERVKLTSKILSFYGALHHGIEDDSRVLMNQISQVRISRYKDIIIREHNLIIFSSL